MYKCLCNLSGPEMSIISHHISPHLYNVYIDALSHILGRSHAGCFINDVCMNHFVYADDTVILAPSAHGLQELLLMCENYGMNIRSFSM